MTADRLDTYLPMRVFAAYMKSSWQHTGQIGGWNVFASILYEHQHANIEAIKAWKLAVRNWAMNERRACQVGLPTPPFVEKPRLISPNPKEWFDATQTIR